MQNLATTARRARDGDLVVFFANGLALTSWTSRVPDVRAMLQLSPGRLALLLLAVSAGAVVGLPLAGRVAHRLGAARTVQVAAVVATAGLVLGAWAVQARSGIALVAVPLFVLGLGNGVWDVAQNLEGTVVEQAVGRAIMPWFHAGFSGGTVLAAAIGALMTWWRVPIGVHVTVVAALCLAAVLWATTRFLPAFEESEQAVAAAAEEGALDAAVAAGDARPAGSAWLEPRTLLIGLMVLAAAFTEGTANDWMAVAFVDGHHLRTALGVVALAVFLVAMTAGRVFGTRLLDRHGRVGVLRVLFVLAVVGCALVVLAPTPLAFLGAAVWGLGASLGFPVGMSAAADDPARAAMRLSVVSTIGYLAFLGGPPLLGFLGDHVGVLHALLAVGVMSLLATFLVPVAAPPTPQARAAGSGR